ncbi:hypothetical protein Q3A66_09335 [Hymenobacter sp. BT770]|uniref:hypothetical protein n=1 Tax=Hymenobacter sp. BT770 TaxID=2886942 RepID=UPI001D10A999|nr:hypothetical protein [Hymenobacter sp. BT770]MCC3152048.1 hypothetical protein [Hymenobacter sp. BT770]MDO3415269.1 hypothetical protein [Hymenobacter sp. BT770]
MKKRFLIAGIGCAILCSSALDATAQAAPKSNLKYGKYGCTATKYKGGFYEFIPHGSFTINADGTYFYSGFEKPSKGKFSVDKDGNLLFAGGYLDKGKAEKIDRPDKFFLVFPTIPDNRWTCSCVEK